MNATIHWSHQTSNRKTGNIPTAWVGATHEESRESCSGCPLRDSTCYAHNGAVKMGLNSLLKNRDTIRGLKTLANALRGRAAEARYVRVSAIGDAARTNPAELRAQHDTVRSAGLGWISYTHFADEARANGVADLFVASAGTMDEADRYLADGYARAAVVAPFDAFEQGYKQTTPAGNMAVICPAIAAHSKGKRLTCNQCGLCDPAKSGPKVILFPEHGSKVRKQLNAAAKAGKEWAKNLLETL